jgi:hypothetical protein
VNSEQLGLAVPSLGGGLIVERPGRAHLVVMSPVGGPVVTLTTDSTKLGLMISRGKQWVEEPDGQGLIRDATQGAVSLDDIVGLLLGHVPLQEQDVVSRHSVDAITTLVAEGPGETTLTAEVDALSATPRSLSVTNRDGEEMVRASYEPFEMLDDVPMPTSVVVYVKSIDLELRLRYKSWKALDEAPDVFGVSSPDGFETISFKEFGAAMAEALGPDPAQDEVEAADSE